MLFREFGDPQSPAVVLLHGGGLSWWSWQPIIDDLSRDHFLIVPIIDGHGDDGGTTFLSLRDSAQKLLSYIDGRCGGRLFAIGGLSLGAQITVEALALRPGLARYALPESALVCPMGGARLVTALYRPCYRLLRSRRFAKVQARSLFVPDERFEQYFTDSNRISLPSLVNIARANGSYRLPSSLRQCSANVLILTGEKELPAMLRSARSLHEALPHNTLQILPGLKHGQLSLTQPDEYLRLFRHHCRF